jgi:hypothetical protein
MPWDASDAKSHNKAAKTPKEKRQWSDVANSVLDRTGDDGEAVRIANGVLKRRRRNPDMERSRKALRAAG